MTVRPRRSVLYMPGSNARALEKARGIAADALILDLEDAVAPDAKELARRQVARCGQGQRLRQTRSGDPHQCAVDRLGRGRSESRRRRRPRCHPRAQSLVGERPGRRRDAFGQDADRRLGDGRNAARHPQHRRDRGRRRQARLLRHGHERSHQGIPRRAHAGPAQSSRRTWTFRGRGARARACRHRRRLQRHPRHAMASTVCADRAALSASTARR